MTNAIAMRNLKAIIAELPKEQVEKTKALAESIRKTVQENGEPGFLALALVGVELAVEKESQPKVL